MRALTLLALSLVLVSLLGCERRELDRKMEELCKRDGGMTIYEKEVLPASEFSNVGQPLAKYAQKAQSLDTSLGPNYRYILQITIVAGRPNADPKRGEGLVERVYQAVIRRSDGKVLGEYVEYRRGGGDGFTFGFQPSGDYCPKPAVSLINSIFVKEE